MKIQRPDEPINWSEVRFGELSPAELKEAYALAKATFSADDLQRYTEVEEDVPFEDILAELEAMLKQNGQEKS